MAEGEISYTWQDALADGTFVKIFESEWPVLSGGAPILATRMLYDAVSPAALMEVYNGYVQGANALSTGEERAKYLFTTQINRREVSATRGGRDARTLLLFWADEY